MTTAPALYIPTAVEIMKVAQSAARRHPEMVSRIEKAAQILLSGGLQLEPAAWERCNSVNWRIASQSHGGAYVVVGLGCPCEDCRSKRAAYCKHSIAAALYMKILRNKINADIRCFNIELGVLGNGQFHAYGRRMGYVQMARLGESYTFVNHASAAHYSLWLAKCEPVRLPIVLPVHSAAFAAAA